MNRLHDRHRKALKNFWRRLFRQQAQLLPVVPRPSLCPDGELHMHSPYFIRPQPKREGEGVSGVHSTTHVQEAHMYDTKTSSFLPQACPPGHPEETNVPEPPSLCLQQSSTTFHLKCKNKLARWQMLSVTCSVLTGFIT